MAWLQKSLHSARLIGFRNALHAIFFAVKRDRYNASFAYKPFSGNPHLPGNLLSYQNLQQCSRVRFEFADLEVRFLAQDLLFIGWDGAEMTPSYAVDRIEWPYAEVAVQPTTNGYLFRSPSLQLHVAGDGSLRLLDSGGRWLREDEPPSRFDRGWIQRTVLPPEACIYGLGERASRLNLRPGSYRFWNTDAGGQYGPGSDPLYVCMPLYMCLHSQGGYLIFYDNPLDGTIDLGKEAELRMKGGPIRFYLITGTPVTILQRLTELTGRAPLPPRWAFGYQQSRWGYQTEKEMRRIYAGFQEHKLPVSVLYLDADHMRGYRTMTLDETRYPSLEEFARELAECDTHLVASVNPAIKIESGLDMYAQGLHADIFCKTPEGEVMEGVVWPGKAAFPDFTDPKVRLWWGKQYTRLVRHGIRGFWHDMNEPSSFSSWGDMTLPLPTRHAIDGIGGDHLNAHNIYGLQMNRAAYEGLCALYPDLRPYIVSRSGWVGMQRYSWNWTGDTQTSWAALRQTIACLIGLGLCGMPYSGPDIGGFSGAPSPELYIRWFQAASFMPFFRTHCAFYLPQREPWEFGAEYLEILRAALDFRYRTLPYWYTLAWQASKTGYPPVRPLFWDSPHDARLWEVDDAFLLGDALLVAPILEKGAFSRSLSLPSGGWYNLHGDHFYTGESQIELDAPLDCIPVLARAGSIIPTREGDSLVLHIYQPLDGQTCQGKLYSDAGDGYGDSRYDAFELAPSKSGFDLSWASAGDFLFPYKSVFLNLHGTHFPHKRIEIKSPFTGTFTIARVQDES